MERTPKSFNSVKTEIKRIIDENGERIALRIFKVGIEKIEIRKWKALEKVIEKIIDKGSGGIVSFW